MSLTVITDSTPRPFSTDNTPIVNQNTISGYDPQTGKWSWKKFFTALIEQIPYIGPAIAAGMNKIAPPADLPAEEANAVEEWIASTFAPFVKKISAATGALLQSGVDASNIGTVNTTLNYLCVLKQYFATNDNTTFLSEGALNYRYDLIATMCEDATKAITGRIAQMNTAFSLASVPVNTAGMSFTPVITLPVKATYPCMVYTATKQTIDAGTPTAVQTVTTVATTTTPAPENKISKPLMWLAVTILTAIGVEELLKDKKTKPN